MTIMPTFQTIKDVRIPMSDGVTLAADLYLPEGEGPFPAVMSCYPYHKDDLIGALFDFSRRHFAANGFAELIVDFRGTGRSEGYCPDTWDTYQEGKDGAEAVEWIAAQPWCTGNVGVWGMSYGGITTLNIASHRPPHLKACLPLFGTPDIYQDFIYPGGIFNAIGDMTRETFMLAMDLAPVTYQDSEGKWRELWREHMNRLDEGDIWALKWQSHVEYDEHWTRRTADVSTITAPTFFIGGWNDIFPDGMYRAFESLTVAKRIVMGPWVHVLPDGSPVEPWDWLSEAVRWWNRWLRDEQNGIDTEPPVKAFMQGANVWIEAADLPVPHTEQRQAYLGADGTLTWEPGAAGSATYAADPRVGIHGALFDPMGTGLGYPLEQSVDNLRSLCFTSAPLDAPLDILGPIQATLRVTLRSGPELDLVVKVCAVNAQGASSLVATGWLNGRHRAGHATNDAVPLDTPLDYPVRLWATGYRLQAGDRLRVAVSCADWPHSFPTATNPTIELHFGGDAPSRVVLPVLTAASGVREFQIARPEAGVNRAPHSIEAKPKWTITESVGDESVSVNYGTSTAIRLPHGPRFELTYEGTAHVSRARPDGASVVANAVIDTTLNTGEHVRVSASNRFTRTTMLMNGRVEVDGRVLLDRQWKNT
jgi:putative CocE/NonD family hydrolase